MIFNLGNLKDKQQISTSRDNSLKPKGQHFKKFKAFGIKKPYVRNVEGKI